MKRIILATVALAASIQLASSPASAAEVESAKKEEPISFMVRKWLYNHFPFGTNGDLVKSTKTARASKEAVQRASR